MGFSIGPENFESLALGDTPLEALMLGDVELWSASPSVPDDLQPMTVGSTTTTWVDQTGEGTERTIFTFQVTGAGKGRFKVSLNGPAVPGSGLITRQFGIRTNGGATFVKTWSGPSQPDQPWVLTDALTDELTISKDQTFQVHLVINAALPSYRYINSWSIELIPSEVEVPVDPTEPVVITGTLWGESQTQFRDALTARGLDYQTVTTIPFPMDTSQATGLQGLFQDCAALTSVPELDTSNVTNMINMFYSCASLSTVPAMDTSNVTNMSAMYAFNPALTGVPEMDTSNVTDMSYMFSWCTALAYVPDMDTSNVTNMTSMLAGTQSLTDGNIRLFGRHPSVNTSGMIEWSGLTVEPFFSPVATTTALTVTPAEVTEGESVTLTAIVTPPEEGSITFAVAGQSSTVEVIGGEASATFTIETSGVYTATAEFDPTSEFVLPSSDSDVLTVLAPAVETATDLTFSPLEPTEFEEFTLTATVTPSEAVGSILFTIDGQTSTVPVAGGVATETFTIEVAGDYPVTAEFVPDDEANFTTSSDSDIITITELVATQTTTVLSVVPDEIVEGEQVLLTATVTPSSAVGDVTFTVDGQTSTVALAGGTASTTLTLATPGAYSITADFVPTDALYFTTSSGTGSVTVTEFVPTPTTTVLTVDPVEIEEGETVTVTATISPSGAVGSVDFDVAGELSTVAVVGGVATTTATLNTAGVFDVTADFVPSSGDFTASSDTSSITVTEASLPDLVPMSWGGSSSVAISTAEHQLVNYTVVGNGTAKLSASVRTYSNVNTNRTVRLYVNGAVVDSYIVSGINHVVAVGTLRAELSDGDLLRVTVQVASGTTRNLTTWSVGLIPLIKTQTSVAVSSSQVERGETVTVTATVTPLELAGSVTFTGVGEPSIVNVVNGVASSTFTLYEAGEQYITATFSPDDVEYTRSSRTTSVTVAEGDLALVPMSWADDGSGSVYIGKNLHELVNYSVIGDGVATLPVSVRTHSDINSTRTVRLYVNGVQVGSTSASGTSHQVASETFSNVALQHGDNLSLTVQISNVYAYNAGTVNIWSLAINPSDP